jgi:hypothetical protein
LLIRSELFHRWTQGSDLSLSSRKLYLLGALLG